MRYRSTPTTTMIGSIILCITSMITQLSRVMCTFLRNRARTVQEAARIKSRVQKVLEEANVKLGSVATDVLGVSGRLMLNGLVAGKQDPEELA